MNQFENLKKISYWGKVSGYALIVAGVINALYGAIVGFLVGGLPGIITIFLGLYLLRSAKQAELLANDNGGSMDELLSNYAKFLKFNGILMIISVVLLVILMFAVGIILASISSTF